ncbi:TetR family transcriptional regulator [Paenibacillus sp. FSL R10-2748]|jgi:AcrR family transcriptional regulator|uniref:TetR family transcriptional regulator n=2 Tax=Paenibacillus TaxID=44249 RepID=UPI00048D9115
MNNSEPPKSKRMKQKDDSRRLLIEAAVRCFSRNGFHKTGIVEIAKEAGMSAGNLYRHFPSKDAFIIALVEEEQRHALAKMEFKETEKDPLGQILTIITSCVSNPVYPMDQRLWIEILAEASRNKGVRHVFNQSDIIMRESFKNLLTSAIHEKQVDPDYDVETLSLWLYALIDGLIARTATDEHFSFDHHMSQFNQLIRQALKPKELQ